MGSFDVTCAVSGLPARGAVRYFLMVETDRERRGDLPINLNALWSPLTIPMVARYDDSASVSAMEPPLLCRAWRDQLRACLVPEPRGAEARHEPEVSRRATLDAMIQACRVGRLRVSPLEDCGRFLESNHAIEKINAECGVDREAWRAEPRSLIPENVPTWRRVERVLRSAGVKGVRAYPDGFARVIVTADYRKGRHAAVASAVEAAGFAACEHKTKTFGDVATLVTPIDYRAAVADRTERLRKPDTIGRRRPLAVSQTFVREDVWQSLLDARSSTPLDLHMERARGSVECLEERPFVSSPADTLYHARKIAAKHENLRGELEGVTRSCGELLKVRETLAEMKSAWMPSRYSGQRFAWQMHAEMLTAWSAIAQREADEERAERARWENDDE